MKYSLIFLAFFMLASPVYADGGGEGEHTGCNGEGNPNSPCEGGEGGGGGGGGGSGGGSSTSTNTNDNTNTNTQGQQQGQIQGQIATGGNATGGAGGEGGDASIYIGGAGQGECYEGECEGGNGAFSNENNVSNDSSSTSGSVSVADSDSTSNSESNNDNDNSNSNDVNNDVDVVVEGDDIVYEAAAIPVNSAPPSFSAICSSGASGTGKSLSLSLAVTNDVCQALMMADAYMALGDKEEALKWVKAAGRHAKTKGGLGYIRHILTIGIL